MEKKFTKGPWVWVCDSALWSEKYGEVLEAGDDGGAWGMHSAEIHHHYNEGIKEANKRLIAAAPCLLEALELMVRSLATSDEEGLIEHTEPMMLARAAIAKALGKS